MPVIPWLAIQQNPDVYLDTTQLPRGVKLKHPSQMSPAEVWSFILHIQESQTSEAANDFRFRSREDIVRRLECQAGTRYVSHIVTLYHTHGCHPSTNTEGPAPKGMPEKSWPLPKGDISTTDRTPGQDIEVSNWDSISEGGPQSTQGIAQER